MAVGEPILNIVNKTMLDAGLTKIADAIRAKGGSTAQLAFPDGMADAIAAIEAGGNVAYGTFVVAEQIYGYNVTVTHGLGARPTFYCAIRMNATARANAGKNGFLACYSDTERLHLIGSLMSSGSPIESINNTYSIYFITGESWKMDATTMKFLPTGVNGSTLFAGESYFWVAGVTVT